MNSHVLLINLEISSGCPTAFVIGRSGRKYGRSIFRRNLASLGIKGISHGHVCKITQADYAAGALDIKEAGRNRQNAWLVVPIDETPQENPASRAPEVIEFEAGYNLAMDGRDLPDDASQAAKMGHELVVWKMATETHKAGPTEGDEPSPSPQSPIDPTLPEVHAGMHWQHLKKIAIDEGVSLEGVKGAQAIVDVIMAKRGLVPA